MWRLYAVGLDVFMWYLQHTNRCVYAVAIHRALTHNDSIAKNANLGAKEKRNVIRTISLEIPQTNIYEYYRLFSATHCRRLFAAQTRARLRGCAHLRQGYYKKKRK